MKAILYEKLKEYAQSNQYPFHMPGHKGGREGIFPQVAQMDITEIDGFDNLHQPEGILAQAQALCAKTFGGEQSYFLVNGSTAGILAAVLGSCGDSEKILLARNCHKSVYSAVILSGAKAEYILPEYFTEMDFYGGVTVESCEKALSLHPDAKALVITSPSYEGFTSDIANIAEAVHKKGAILIVDEAHGSHMKFHPYFPKTALEQGADIVIQSLHKTLPSFTQTAVMHIQGDRVDRTRLQQALSMVQSTSPSYLFLASIDSCRSWLDGQEGKVAFEKYVKMLQEFRSSMADNQSILLLGKEVCSTHGVADIDLGKLIFYIPQGQVTGVELGKMLRQRFGLQMELCGNTHIIAMTSPADDEEGFLRLQKAILYLDKEISEIPISTIDFSEKMRQDIPVAKYTPRQGYFAQKKEVFLEESIGNICGEFVIPYPPGAPLLVPGEVITEKMVKKMQAYRKNGICFIGCEDSSLQKIRIISM
jgi:arginine/lysine/ornithine decarboxylase